MSAQTVVKFGGSNLKNSSDFIRLARIVKAYNRPLVIVVSATFGLTNKIEGIIGSSINDHTLIAGFIENLKTGQVNLVNQNIHDERLQNECLHILHQRTEGLEVILQRIAIIGEVSPSLHDLALSYGERLSSVLLSHILTAHGIACEEILPENLGLITDGHFGDATVNFARSAPKVKAQLNEDKTYVVPGFYGISADGEVTLLGRGGSDFSAAAIAHCIDARYLDIWKDVNGFLSADPRFVPNARHIAKLSYNEAAELAYFGARILHPGTISPLKAKKSPLRIFNIENHDNILFPATTINGSAELHPGVIKSIAFSDDFGILRLKGAGVGARSGILAEVTNRLDHEKINIKSVITSQISINILLSVSDLEKALKSITDNPLATVHEIETVTNISVVAVVGEGLMEQTGIMYKVLEAAASQNINIRTIVMGASEVSAYLIVDQSDRNLTINIIHQNLFETDKQLNTQQYEITTAF